MGNVADILSAVLGGTGAGLETYGNENTRKELEDHKRRMEALKAQREQEDLQRQMMAMGLVPQNPEAAPDPNTVDYNIPGVGGYTGPRDMFLPKVTQDANRAKDLAQTTFSGGTHIPETGGRAIVAGDASVRDFLPQSLASQAGMMNAITRRDAAKQKQAEDAADRLLEAAEGNSDTAGTLWLTDPRFSTLQPILNLSSADFLAAATRYRRRRLIEGTPRDSTAAAITGKPADEIVGGVKTNARGVPIVPPGSSLADQLRKLP